MSTSADSAMKCTPQNTMSVAAESAAKRGELERVARRVGPADHLVALVVVTEDQEPVAERRAWRRGCVIRARPAARGCRRPAGGSAVSEMRLPRGVALHWPVGGSPVATPRGCRPQGLQYAPETGTRRTSIPLVTRLAWSLALRRDRDDFAVPPEGEASRARRDNGSMFTRPEPGIDPRRARVVPVPRRRGPGHLRGQGQEPARRGSSNYFGPPASLTERTRQMVARRRPRRVDRGPQRGRGAVPRVQPHQAAPAALQHPPEGRQVLPVPRGHARRGMAAGDGDAGQQAQGRALLRPVRARVRDPRDARPPPAHVPDPHVHEQQVRPPPQARPPVPLRAHREVLGAVRRRHHRRGLQAARRRSSSTSSTARPTRSSHRLDDADARRRPTRWSSSARHACATSSRASARRSNASRWSARARRTTTCSGSPRTSSRRRCRCSTCARAGSSGARGIVVDKVEDVETPALGRADRRAALRRRAAVRHPEGDPRSRSSPTTSTSTRSSSRSQRGIEGAGSACRSEARSASCSRPPR